MIRRGFWLVVGATGGIMGYRRVAALGRRVSGALNQQGPDGQGQGRPRPRRRKRGAIGWARETVSFTRDVREGMELYVARHSEPEGPTLGAQQPAPHHRTPRHPAAQHDERNGR